MHTREEKLKAFGRMLDVVDTLREKCPWDRKQTNESLRPNTIEEVFELADAISKSDTHNICKELGDVLLHICFYSRIGSETGDFDIADVCNALVDKLIFRHPHVYHPSQIGAPDPKPLPYGEEKAENADGEEVKTAQQVIQNWEQLKLKEKDGSAIPDQTVTIQGEDEEEEIVLTVLEEYKTLFNKNKSLIGWIKIADTNGEGVFIDYPVMQSQDSEYYLTHNFYQEYDKNGSIFLDPACDIVHRSTNLIIYGHHMKSGEMFGNLDRYSSEAFYKEHRYIQFDTIYEKGTYEVMYVFRSRIYNEDEIVFKYYQFIDVDSEAEFYSNMNEMEQLALYDTGVTAVYGDELLTLSTCDYQETNGRFVVVAKRID